MFQLRRLSSILFVLTYFLQAQGADKYTDENRPYEFGFTIDGEQHRHEKKDEKGLIMGEFGFITADGVYHVTVYATDENGNFKILSMKNIRVKPYPTAPVKKGHSLQFPPSQQSTNPQGPAQQKPVSIEPPARSCSHCSLPTTKAPPALTDYAVVSQDNQYNPQNPQYPQGDQNYPQQNYPSQPGAPQTYPGQPDAAQTYPGQPGAPQDYPGQPGASPDYPGQPGAPQDYPGQLQNYPEQKYPQNDPNYLQQNYPGQPGAPQNYPGENYPGQPGAQQYPEQNPAGERNPKQYDDIPEVFSRVGQGPSKPTLVSAQMQIVDKNTDIYQRRPGEKEGLPNGLTKGDMKLLLYTFNYTVGFHGHYEEGYTNGAKTGYYFVTGRNGVRTRVDYVADDKGFRPKISQEVLDLLSEDVPKPETEKDAKYGLKGYEFKWIYYPVESKKR